MLKKLIFFTITFCLSLSSSFLSFASDKIIIPLKKPILTEQELKKKILSNILVPLQKPQIINENIEPKKKVENNNPKIGFLIPKKKPQITSN